jgi:hypothetical protein
VTHGRRTSTPAPLVAIDSSEIREGKIDELKTGLTELVEFVEANEAEPIAYGIYIDEAGSRMTVMQIHPSSESMELHMRLAGPIFQKFTELVVLSRIDFLRHAKRRPVGTDASEGGVARERPRGRE